MRKYILVLILILIGCTSKKQKHELEIHRYHDSFEVYRDRSMCYLYKDNQDSFSYNSKIAASFIDSMEKYYYLDHPDMKPEEEKINCNCK